MKLQPDIIEARFRAGYRAPEDNPLVCARCSAIRRNGDKFTKFFCRRHKFYVHSRGYCPSFSNEPFVEKPVTEPLFKQEELFK